MKFEDEGLEFAKYLRSLDLSNLAIVTEKFAVTCSWRILRSKLYIITIRFPIGKNDWDLETYRKS